ncbi:MAG: RipA family octameric membrane protein [Streptosporangiaceae bacterium]
MEAIVTQSAPHGSGQPTLAPVSFDEFKLYYESAEKVTERRLSTNRWNYSVSTAIVLTIGAVLSFSTSHETFTFVAAVSTFFLSAIAFLFCTYWIKQIDDFKALNTAKFAVLEKMAPNVVFDSSGSPSPAKSFEPFRKEWDDLKAASMLQAMPRRVERVLALKSTRQEYFLPQAFRFLFVVIFLITLLFAITSHSTVFGHMSPFAPAINTGPGK